MSLSRITRNAVIVAAGFGAMALAQSAMADVTVPDEYAAATIAVGLTDGRDIVSTPDGRMLIMLGTGEIRVLENDALLATPMISIPVGNGGNKGLHTIALDDDFANNGHFFAVFTPPGQDFNRVSRFTATGNTASLASEVALYDLPVIGGSPTHYGGAIVDAGDGTLIVTVGDHEVSSHGQNLSTREGSALRINKDGTIPADNPYVGVAGNDAIYASGLRNPWQAARQASTGRVVISDVGSSLWEEVNELSAGANFGWADAEGAGGVGDDPLWTYPHFGLVPGAEYEGCAVTGGTFYEPDVVQLPSRYVGDLFVGDLCTGFIVAIDPATGVAESFASGFASLADLATNQANGALYALDRNIVDNRSGIIKIEYVGPDVSLRITSQPSTQRLAVGQRASFFVGAVGQGNLEYQWQRNGVDLPGETSATYVLDPVSAVDDGAQFRAIVTDELTSVTSSIAEIIVTDNTAPTPTINEPAAGTDYGGGQVFLATGGATDVEDGTLDMSSLTWEVRLNHDEHDHGYTGVVEGTDQIQITIPQTGETSDNVWYTIYLTAVDSDGTTSTVTRRLDPRKVDLTFDTDPTGGVVNVDGPAHAAPFDTVGVEGVFREVRASEVQEFGGVPHGFTWWSNGQPREHTYTTPAAADTLTANYAPLPFGTGQNPACSAVNIDGSYVVTLSGNLGSSVNLLRNNKWLQTVTGFEYFVDGDAPGGTVNYTIRVRQGPQVDDYPCQSVEWPPDDPPPTLSPVCTGTRTVDDVALSFSGDRGTSATLLRDGSVLADVTGLATYDDQNAPAGAAYVLRASEAGVTQDAACDITVDPPTGGPVCTGTWSGSTVSLAFSGDLGTSAVVRRDGVWIATVTGQSTYDDVNAPADAEYVLRTRAAGVVTDATCDVDGDPPPPPTGFVCTGTRTGDTVSLAFDSDQADHAFMRRDGAYLADVTGVTSYDDVGAPVDATYVLRTWTVGGASADTDCSIDGDPPPPTGFVCTGTRTGDTVSLSFDSDAAAHAFIRRNGQYLATVTGLTSYDDVGAPAAGAYVLRTWAGVDGSADTDCDVDGDPPPPPPTGDPTCAVTIAGDMATFAFGGDRGSNAFLRKNGSYFSTVTGLDAYEYTGHQAGDTYVLRTRDSGILTDTDCTEP